MTWLSRLWLRWLNRHDPAATTTRLKFTTARDYDADQASAAAKRARTQSATGRKYLGPKKPKACARVTPFRQTRAK